MDIVIILLILLIGIILIFIAAKKYSNETSKYVKSNKKLERMTQTQTMKDNNLITSDTNTDEFMTETQFHIEYMDVINACNDLSAGRQIFNVNNDRCKTTKDTDIEHVGELIDNFIDTLNEHIKVSVPITQTMTTSWNSVATENSGISGWEKQMKLLGLPSSLYNKPHLMSKVSMQKYTQIVKYETDDEIKYTCNVVLRRDYVKDKLVIKISFIHPKNMDSKNVIIEEIFVIGTLSSEGLGNERTEMDDLYYFDNLNDNNMMTGKSILKELTKQYEKRKKSMQERVDGMDNDVIEKYATSPSPAAYDSYKLTQTIYDDINNNMNKK